MSVDPNSSSMGSPSTASPSFTAMVMGVLKQPLDFPQEFTQWVYAIVANPVLQPQIKGVDTVAAPLTQTFADSGHTDFFQQGCYVVEVLIASSIIGSALVYCGLQTGGSARSVVVMASGVADAGIVPTFSVQNGNSSTAVFRTLTTGSTGETVTVTYRRTTVTS